VKGQRVLPGVAYVEMARAAVVQAAGILEDGQTGIRLKNMVWTRPITVGEHPVQVHIGLFPEENGEIAYEIYSESEDVDAESVVHSRGIAALSSVSEAAPTLDLNALQGECSRKSISSSQCYEVFREMGIDYGRGYQGVEIVYVGYNQVLAKLSLPSSVSETADQFVLHPSLMESSLQASIGLMMGTNNLILPDSVGLKEVVILGDLTSTMWALIRYCEGCTVEDKTVKYDIDLCDEQGRICVQMQGVEMQENANGGFVAPIDASLQSALVPEIEEGSPVMTFEEVWQERAIAEHPELEIKTLVCFLSNPENQKAVVEAVQTLDQQTKIIFVSQSEVRASQQEYHILRADEKTYVDTFERIQEDISEVDAVLYLWPLEDPDCIKDYSCIVYILKAMVSTKLKSRRFLLVAEFENALDRCYLESWIGFERSLGLVMPNTQVAIIYQETLKNGQEYFMKDWTKRLLAELQTNKVQSALYQDGKRHVCQIKPTTIQKGNTLLKSGGTYLVTGGGGGLGFIFAEHFAKAGPVNLILTGRSPIDEKKQSKIEALEDLGSQVEYVQADICDLTDMKECLRISKERFGGIRGVIHAAGLEVNQTVFEKEFKNFQNVLDPKIKGTLILDEVLLGEPLDFVCYFSSSSAILGDFGSCDYSTGNRFQMAYGQYRNHLQRQGQRKGKAIVINWPLWKEGGIGIGDDENTQMYLKSSGQRSLETEEGLKTV